jgi:hypothetical protein
MRSLSLKRKESRIAWQVLLEGVVALDRKMKRASQDEQDDYQKLRSKLLVAWRSGVLVGGVRPKRKISDIMPASLLQETELANLRKETRQAKAKAKREISVPHKRQAA